MGTKVDEWVRWLTLVAVLALALFLLSVGISLYAKPTAPVINRVGTMIDRNF